jgi:hypothetical protein
MKKNWKKIGTSLEFFLGFFFWKIVSALQLFLTPPTKQTACQKDVQPKK